MIRGSALHDSLAHVAKVYNLVYQQIDAQSHPLGRKTPYLTPIGNYSKEYVPDKPRSNTRYEHEENSAFNIKIARTIAHEIKKERNLEGGMMDWTGMLVDRAIKIYNKVLVGSGRASNMWVPKPMAEEGKRILQDHVLRELTTVLAPPSAMFQQNQQLSSSSSWKNHSSSPDCHEKEFNDAITHENHTTTTTRSKNNTTHHHENNNMKEQYTPESFGMEGTRLPLLIEEPFVLKNIGGREDIDMVFIFDRVDLERDKKSVVGNAGCAFTSPFKPLPTDKHVLVEYKTKIKPHNVELYRTQLAMYHYAFKELFGIPADKSYLTCIDSGAVYEFDDSEFDSMDTEFMIIDCADNSKFFFV